jgi:hypothetical protein
MAETGNTFYTDEIGKLKTFVENAKKILKNSKLEENKENTKIKEDTEIKEDKEVKEDKKSNETFERTYIAPPAETPIPTNQGGEDFTTPNIEEQSLKNKQKLDSLNKNKEEDTIAEMKKNSAQWLSSITLERKKELADKNLELGQKMGWNRTSTGIWLKPDGTKAYKKGGIVDYTGLAEVHGSETEPEAFLNSKQTELFSGLIKQLPNFNLNTIGQSSTGKTEIYDIKINEVKTNDASAFINNLKSLTYSKGRGR